MGRDETKVKVRRGANTAIKIGQSRGKERERGGAGGKGARPGGCGSDERRLHLKKAPPRLITEQGLGDWDQLFWSARELGYSVSSLFRK